MISDKLYAVIFGAMAALILALAIPLIFACLSTIPNLRKQVSELTVQRDTGQSDIAALRAAQDVQSKAIADLVNAAHERDAAAESAVNVRISASKRPPIALHSAQELNAWLSSLSSQ